MQEPRGYDSNHSKHKKGNRGKALRSKRKPESSKEALDFKEVTDFLAGLQYHKAIYTTGKDPKDQKDRLILRAYIQTITFSDQ